MKKILRYAIPAVFYAALAVFLGVYLAGIDYAQLASLRIDPGWLIAATVVAVVSLYGFVGVWIVILRSLGASVTWSPALSLVYAKAWLGRYIPGKVPWILGKIYFASQHGISRSKLAVSSTLEAGLQIVVQFILAFALLAFDVRLGLLDTGLKVAMVVALVLCIVAVLPPVFNRVLRFGMRVFRRELATEHAASWKTVLSGGGYYLIAIAINGVALYLVARAIVPDLGIEYAVFVVGANILAGVVGMLAVFAPSGLGVREGLLVVFLGLVMSPAEALAVAVLSRLWSVIVDALFVGSALAIDGIAGRRTASRPVDQPSDGTK